MILALLFIYNALGQSYLCDCITQHFNKLQSIVCHTLIVCSNQRNRKEEASYGGMVIIIRV